MGASWSAQALRQANDMPSGPGAFLIFCPWKSWHTSSSQILSTGGGSVGRGGAVTGGLVSYTYSRAHSGHQPVDGSPLCGGIVSCSLGHPTGLPTLTLYVSWEPFFSGFTMLLWSPLSTSVLVVHGCVTTWASSLAWWSCLSLAVNQGLLLLDVQKVLVRTHTSSHQLT